MTVLRAPSPAHRLALAALLALAVALPWLGGAFLVRFAAEILLIGTAVCSLNLLMGTGGMASLGHGAIFGAAAYVVAVVAGRLGHAELVWVLPLGAASGMLLGALMGAATLRTSGLFFLVLTLVLGQMVWEVAFRWHDVTGGADGLRGFPRLSVAGQPLASATALYLVAAGTAMVGWWLLRSYARAPIGLALAAWRDQPLRVDALGWSAGRLRVSAFILAGGVAGLAGAVYPFLNQYVGPNTVHWSMSAAFIIMAVIGGIGSRTGGFVGAAVYLFVQTYVSSHTDRWQLVIGVIFVATVVFMPHGIAHLWRERRRSNGDAHPAENGRAPQ
ncbi:branched-chain amino acid ABC transporter permease [Verticiella sediminum]|uniref:Branched-chain amino acid ABC transporter permease n=1 Tax=Verticiella sediminum TaxID=1247510 RepID=A0A556A5V1_9BURK|nr:branched-chain amino acid ABC transporter permease [Verticiella sediminum]TSH88265.1 branched-chain amino acid ABC transporter permease [Verticiella sediminum]